MAGLSLGCRMKGFYMSTHYGLAVMANRGITSDRRTELRTLWTARSWRRKKNLCQDFCLSLSKEVENSN